MLSLDYQAFDQTPGGGWREPAERGEYLEAAQLIDDYLAARTDLDPRQCVNLRFHAGQMYAFGESTELAVERFRASIFEPEPEDSPLRWNAYVRATIAFLEQDRPTLDAMREEIAGGPELGGMIPNLDVVDRLRAGFGGTYAAAYRPVQDGEDR